MPPWVFFASLVVYRVTILAAQAALLVAVGTLVFHVRIIGNPLEILAVLLLGTATFVSLGTIVGAVARTTESANNIASVLTVPLAFLSDAYIPIDRFPHAVAATLRLLPSTQFIDTFRAVSIGGASARALRRVARRARALGAGRHSGQRPYVPVGVNPTASCRPSFRRTSSRPSFRPSSFRSWFPPSSCSSSCCRCPASSRCGSPTAAKRKAR